MDSTLQRSQSTSDEFRCAAGSVQKPLKAQASTHDDGYADPGNQLLTAPESRRLDSTMMDGPWARPANQSLRKFSPVHRSYQLITRCCKPLGSLWN